MPRTTSRHRLLRMSSGYVRSFLRRASVKAVPAYCPAVRRGGPSMVRGETMVVSTASWTPPKLEPFATTSMRGSSCLWMWSRFKSVTKVLVVTHAPASRHMRAAARSGFGESLIARTLRGGRHKCQERDGTGSDEL